MKHLYILVILVLGFVSCKPSPKVIIETSLGDIGCELYDDKAPITVSNFLRYVDEQRYDNAAFYRVVAMDNQPNSDVKIEVIQGGLYDDDHILMLPPIMHETTMETGIQHLDGTISMARLEPGSASSEFFICINDQPELDFGGKRNPDGQGFAAFGRVVSGMDVVRQIQLLRSAGQMLDDRLIIRSIKRIQ